MLDFSTTTMYSGELVTQNFHWLVMLGGFVCFAMSWGIGANDVANAFSTSVGAKAISLKQAVVIAAIFEFVGAIGLGASVTSTIRKKITNFELFEGEEDVLMLGMFCSLVSASIWLFIATKYNFPVSTTHSIIGAIVGFSVVAKGFDAVDWNQVAFIILFWIVAPCMAGIGSMILFAPLRTFILRKENSYQLSLRYWPLFVFIVAFTMCIFLIIKGLKRLDFDYETQTGLAMLITVCIAAGLALISYFLFIFSGAVDRYVQKAVAKMESEKLAKSDKFQHLTLAEITSGTPHESNDDVVKFIETEIQKQHVEIQTDIENGDDKPSSGLKGYFEKSKDKLTKGVNVDIHDDLAQLERDIHEHSEKFDIKTEKSFAWLQVCTAALDIFAHGSNDVANAVAPFAAMVGLYQDGLASKKVAVPEWILFIGALGMVLGLATYGYKIMKCLGVRMCYITSTRGYCIELSSAVIIILCSVWGYPASTTHAQVGATIGAGLMEKTRSDGTLKWGQVINWKLLAQVFLGWVLTLLFTGFTSGLVFAFLAYSPYGGNVPKNCDV